MRVANLRCENRANPIDIDTARPGLSWTLASDTRGDRQTAYQVLIASSADLLRQNKGDIWDSGRVDSADALQISTPALPGRTAFVWKARVWNLAGQPTAWSEPASFATAIFDPTDWQAKWITSPTADGPLPLFRRAFSVSKPLHRATAYICGLGQFELRCNGQRVGDDLLAPGWTNYRKTCLYSAIDLTHTLHAGDNAIGVMLGHGMYHSGDAPAGTKRYTKFKGSFGPPVLIAEIHLEFADGSLETIVTDEHWHTHAGPITFSNIYGGEDYDARLELPDWDTAHFDATAWASAILHAGPGGALRAAGHAAPPVQISQIFQAGLTRSTSPGVDLYDAGQNCSMVPRLTVRGPAGSRVRAWPAESLKEDGAVNQKHTGGPSFYSYTLRGEGDETFTPRFGYTGGRYLQVDTQPADADGPHPAVLRVESLHLTSATTPAGEFHSSNDLFNRTAGLIDWAARSNITSVLTDCPHREKLGWVEQQYLVGPSLMYRYDLHTHFRKATADHSDAQLASGDVPTICPQYTQFQPPYDIFNDSPEWGSAAVLVPWQVYTWYGDLALLRRQYQTMKGYVNYLTSRATDHLLDHGLGDWYDLGPNPPGFTQLTPRSLTGTATYFHDCEVLAKAANLLGFFDDSATYSALAEQIKTAFNRAFYDAAKHQYATCSQTSLAMPLALGLVPDGDRTAVLENLVADIRGRDNQLTSGDVGYRYLLRALAQAGRHDVIFDMNCRSDRPGYGMMLAKGETSLTEAWDARPQSSLNHFMLGHIQEWFYAGLAGLSQAEDSIAFNRIVIRPNPCGNITHASAKYTSARGEIAVAWKIADGTFTLDCTIPPGTTAVVHFPPLAESNVRESGTPLTEARGVRLVANTICEIESGIFRFTADLAAG